jgi:hypothetical protein
MEERIEIERIPSGLYVATSADLPGLFVVSSSEDDLWKRIPPAIAQLREAMAERQLR